MLSSDRKSVLLLGNPNTGKTSLLNLLTGSSYKTANYPGVTVEKKTGVCILPNNENINITDLPGVYSLGCTSLDEQVTVSHLLSNKPDLILIVVSAASFTRDLFLVTQVLDLKIPSIIVLTQTDWGKKLGITVLSEKLRSTFKIPVIRVNPDKKTGKEDLLNEISLKLHTNFIDDTYDWFNDEDVYFRYANLLGQKIKEQFPKREPQNWFIADMTSEILGSFIISEQFVPTLPKLEKDILETKTNLVSIGIDPYAYEAAKRHEFIQKVLPLISRTNSNSNSKLLANIDKILLHPILGLVFLLLLMFVLFQSVFTFATLPMDLIDKAMTNISDFLNGALPNNLLSDLFVNGVVLGIGNAILFIPQIAILLFLIGLLEESGYLARAAFLLDGIMRRFGLQGRSFIPLLSSFACAIPGIVSTRTIPSNADRIATIMVAPLMSCSARLPVYAAIISAVIPATYYGIFNLQGIVMSALYFLGIIAAAAVAFILKKTLLRREPAVFLMEIPPLKIPNLKPIFRDVLGRLINFIETAGTVILACSIILWFLSSFPKSVDASQQLKNSYAGMLGTILEPIFKPIGIPWEMGIGIITSFAAREVFVSSVATIYNVGNNTDSTQSLISVLKAKHIDGSFSLASAISLLLFYVFACQCMSTLAACKRETGSWWWTSGMFIYMTGLAYFAAWIGFNIFN